MDAIVYAAKSTIDEHGSIPAQLAEGRGWASSEGFRVVAEFADEAASAFSSDRGPGLAAARDLAERIALEDGECTLIVQHSDRLARGDGVQAAHLVEYALWAIKSGVKIRSIQDPQTFADLLYAVVTGQRNYEDSRRKSCAVRAGMARRAQRGLHSGPRPYGYRFDDDRGLAPLDRERVVVAQIFSEFDAGRSLTAIARDLYVENVPTVRGGRWRQSTVHGILCNPVYLGKVKHHDDVLDGAHEPVIDPKLWERVQDRMVARPNKGRGRQPTGQHLFRGGLLRCECGEAMVPRTSGNYQMYYCNGRGKLGRSYCDMPHVRRTDIDTAVYRYFEQIGLDVEATRQTILEARNRKLSETTALHDEALHEARRAEERLARVRRDYLDGKLAVEDWNDLRGELDTERDAARSQAERLATQRTEIEAWGELQDAEAETLRRLGEIRALIAGEIRAAEGLDALRAALLRTFERFVIRRRTRRAHVELIVDPDLVIDPVPREQAISGYSRHLRPILRREPLPADEQITAGQAHAPRRGAGLRPPRRRRPQGRGLPDHRLGLPQQRRAGQIVRRPPGPEMVPEMGGAAGQVAAPPGHRARPRAVLGLRLAGRQRAAVRVHQAVLLGTLALH
jgi:site-specific DNA recombinase